ncbi:unnamed protein product [Sphagnum jensenii]|uniref:Uncharacterized protein n=1 Tax=Sphagnum jensenii TaxID=128206 RepID=A0ABP1A9V1_9BRYO
MRMKCGSCSFHTIVASWHLHLKTVQPSFWEVVDDEMVMLKAYFDWAPEAKYLLFLGVPRALDTMTGNEEIKL